MQKAVQWSLDGGLNVAFNEPVSSVRYGLPGGPTHTLLFASARRYVTLPMKDTTPGQKGTVFVAARAQPWESASGPTHVQWSSAPYVRARQAGNSLAPGGPLTIQFSQPLLHPRLSEWTMAPRVPGQWNEISPTKFSFTPAGPAGFGPGALIRVTIPGGRKGPEAKSGSILASSVALNWTTAPGSVLRLQQLLAEAGYLPVSFTRATPTPTLQYEDSTIYHPPAGQFQWKYPNLPGALKALWTPGQMNVITEGAIMQFERVNGLPVDGIAGPLVWKTLIQDRLAGKTSPDGYSYISVTETLPETLELWVGNKLVLTTRTNTGIPVTPTFVGTFPIYERLQFQIMRGTNPNGVPYADPVYWINYFKGGDAVHGFVRAAYGFPQSLGCVEVPPSVAQVIYSAVHYGTLVTVNPVGVAPAPA